MIKYLRESGAALSVLCLALVAQIPHAAHVFNRAPYIGGDEPTGGVFGWVLAYAYAIALESATLMFVVHGKMRASYGFAVASFLVNLAYYSMHDVNLISLAAAPAILLSALLPIAIASYSHILTEHDEHPVDRRERVVSVRENVSEPVSAEPEPDEHDVSDEPEQRTLASHLKSEGLTNAQIGERLGVHRTTVGKWLNGKVSA